jgi:hypothetical protein
LTYNVSRARGGGAIMSRMTSSVTNIGLDISVACVTADRRVERLSFGERLFHDRGVSGFQVERLRSLRGRHAVVMLDSLRPPNRS